MQTGCLRLVSLAIFAGLAAIGSAHSQDWPQRPAKIVVPFAPGGNSDEVARLVALRLGAAFGQQFVVENRPGARSPADGYTLLLASLPLVAIVPAMTKASFDPVKDLTPVSAIATNPLILVTHPSLPVTSVAELVAYARDQHGQLVYSAAGVGSITHLTMALLLKRAGVEMTPVMYKGGASMLADVIAK